ncbi:cysteine hydrolase [Caulobacter hibisci]|uniref:Cysteine hydrolase n=1 Tax=Caulobacter hibisci TaxID=2035993 RepID=A0ABS0SVV7_9CAUL|nr:cysteine hydrolase [Caulobacter hibisci]
MVLIDLQRAIDYPVWRAAGPRNHPEAEARVADLLRLWRGRDWPVFHVRHLSTNPNSTYASDGPGAAFKPEAQPLPGEPVIGKSAHSAFVGTDLESRLRVAGIDTLVIAGVITNNSVEATVRHAGDLGFQVLLAHEACFTFARRDWSGVLRSAEEVHAMSLANLDGEYCDVVDSAALTERLGL